MDGGLPNFNEPKYLVHILDPLLGHSSLVFMLECGAEGLRVLAPDLVLPRYFPINGFDALCVASSGGCARAEVSIVSRRVCGITVSNQHPMRVPSISSLSPTALAASDPNLGASTHDCTDPTVIGPDARTQGELLIHTNPRKRVRLASRGEDPMLVKAINFFFSCKAQLREGIDLEGPTHWQVSSRKATKKAKCSRQSTSPIGKIKAKANKCGITLGDLEARSFLEFCQASP